jgi:hypothetical protein
LKESGFSAGVALTTTAPQYQNVIDSDELLFQYINIYSAQSVYEKGAILGQAKLENK